MCAYPTLIERDHQTLSDHSFDDHGPDRIGDRRIPNDPDVGDLRHHPFIPRLRSGSDRGRLGCLVRQGGSACGPKTCDQRRRFQTSTTAPFLGRADQQGSETSPTIGHDRSDPRWSTDERTIDVHRISADCRQRNAGVHERLGDIDHHGRSELAKGIDHLGCWLDDAGFAVRLLEQASDRPPGTGGIGRAMSGRQGGPRRLHVEASAAVNVDVKAAASDRIKDRAPLDW